MNGGRTLGQVWGDERWGLSLQSRYVQRLERQLREVEEQLKADGDDEANGSLEALRDLLREELEKRRMQ